MTTVIVVDGRFEGRQQQGPTMRGSDSTRSITVSQDGRWIVSGNSGNEAIVRNATTHEKVREFTRYSGGVTAVD